MKKLLLTLAIFLTLSFNLLAQPQVESRTYTLIWEASTGPGTVDHYIIYYGTESHTYTESIPIGNVTTYDLTLPEDENTYYIAVTAVGINILESGYSNEVNTARMDAPKNFKIIRAIINWLKSLARR